MLLGDKVEPLVARSFGLMHVSAGYALPIVGEDGETIDEAEIDYVWWAQVTGWWAPQANVGVCSFSYHPKKNGRLTLGMLLVVTNLLKLEFLGEQAFRSVELSSKQDRVLKALQSMNLMERYAPIIPGNDKCPRIDLFVSTLNGKREITYSGGVMKDKSWINLREALFDTIATLNELYGDPQIKAALDPKNIRRALE